MEAAPMKIILWSLPLSSPVGEWIPTLVLYVRVTQRILQYAAVEPSMVRAGIGGTKNLMTDHAAWNLSAAVAS